MYAQTRDSDYARREGIFPPTEHPLGWHQEDGCTSLLIGSAADIRARMDRDAGRAWLDDLVDWATSAPFIYRHRWQKGARVVFNTFGLLHQPHPYCEAAGRVMPAYAQWT